MNRAGSPMRVVRLYGCPTGGSRRSRSRAPATVVHPADRPDENYSSGISTMTSCGRGWGSLSLQRVLHIALITSVFPFGCDRDIGHLQAVNSPDQSLTGHADDRRHI